MPCEALATGKPVFTLELTHVGVLGWTSSSAITGTCMKLCN